MNFDKPFWRTVLRDSDGTASSSRLLVTAVVSASLGWGSYLVVSNKALPDLSLLAGFISYTSLSLYGVNRLASAATDYIKRPKSDVDDTK
jgi:hypothetical protein